MIRSHRKRRGQLSDRVLSRLAAAAAPQTRESLHVDPDTVAELLVADLVARDPDGRLALTEAGRARLARLAATKTPGEINPFRSQHFALARRADGRPDSAAVVVNDAESPLAWLARRKSRDGPR